MGRGFLSQMFNLCYVYYLSKLSEFVDTVFFVLRKKKSQISWLHVYHHSLTPIEAWILTKFLAGKTHFDGISNLLVCTNLNRRKHNTAEHHQQLCPHADVLLLSTVVDGASLSEVPLVEEVHDRDSNCTSITQYFENSSY